MRPIGLVVIAAAFAAPTIVEYPIPRAGAFPHDPAVGKDGIVWYTDQANSYIGRLDPATGRITDYATPTPQSGPHGITVAPDGGVWYTANRVGKIGRLDPATGRIREFSLPREAEDPHTLIFFGDHIWFTVQQSDLYGSLDPATGQARVWPVPVKGALPYGIAPAPDGSLWVALFGTNQLGRITTADGRMTLHPLADPLTRPRRIVVDGGGHVWYTDYARGRLGMYDPATALEKQWPAPDGKGSGPYGIAIAPDGTIWYCESGNSRLVAFDPKTGQSKTVDIPTKGAIVRNMETDSTRGRLWLALSGTGRIGQVRLR